MLVRAGVTDHCSLPPSTCLPSQPQGQPEPHLRVHSIPPASRLVQVWGVTEVGSNQSNTRTSSQSAGVERLSLSKDVMRKQVGPLRTVKEASFQMNLIPQRAERQDSGKAGIPCIPEQLGQTRPEQFRLITE